MTIITERFPQCDRCLATNPDYQDGRSTVKELRAAMRKAGWLYRKGEDICPECADAIEKNRRHTGPSP